MGPPIEFDESLVQRSKRGDREAFEELVRRTSRAVFARIYLETADVHKSQDIVQDAFLLAWRSIRSLEDPKSFRPWLFSIAHRALLQSVRREPRTKQGRGLGALGSTPDSRPGPSEDAAAHEQREEVLTALRSLPREYRLPLAMRYLAGADYETIQRDLAISNGSLRGLLHRGMTMLRAQLKQTSIK